ncbi:MAG: transcription regulator [Frankiales bacterium]|nr:transcription regulator [Frankiales bacterium]
MSLVKTLSPPAAPVETDARTRDRVARVLLETGPATTGALAGRLGVTSTAIRRHLDTLVADGVVVAREAPVVGSRGRGRPAKLFALTEAGHEKFGHAYDDIATAALRYLAASAGEQAVTAFAEARAAEIERRYRDVVDAATAEEKVQVLAVALRGDGYAASVSPLGSGDQLCQHHCPVQHVAAEFPQLCVAETAALGRLLGTHVQRLATIAHGDGVCTTHIPAHIPGALASSTTPVTPGTSKQRTDA